MAMLLFVESMLWSIIGDVGFVVSSVVLATQALLSFHILTGKMETRPDVAIRCEELPEVVFRGRKREIPDKDIHRVLLLSWCVDVRCGGSRRSQGNTTDAEGHSQIEQEGVDRDRGGLRSLSERALYPRPLGHPPPLVRVDEPSCGRNRQGQDEDPAHGQYLSDRV